MDKNAVRRFLYVVDITIWIAAVIVITASIYFFVFFDFLSFFRYFFAHPFDQYSYRVIYILLFPLTFGVLVWWFIKRWQKRLEFYKELENDLGLVPPKFLSFVSKGYHGIYKNMSVNYWQFGWGEKGKREGTKILVKPIKKNGGEDILLINLYPSPLYGNSRESMSFELDSDKELNPVITKEKILNQLSFLGSKLHTFMLFKDGSTVLQIREEVLDVTELKQILDLLINFDISELVNG